MHKTIEYSSQQVQRPSCQNGYSLNPTKSAQSEHTHTFSGNSISNVLHLPQSTSTQFLPIKGQKAFLASDTPTSGISWWSTLSSKKDSKSSKDLENLLSFFAKFVFQISEDILTALKKCFHSKQGSEDSKCDHRMPTYMRIRWAALGRGLETRPTIGKEKAPIISAASFRLSWYALWVLLPRVDTRFLLFLSEVLLGFCLPCLAIVPPYG